MGGHGGRALCRNGKRPPPHHGKSLIGRAGLVVPYAARVQARLRCASRRGPEPVALPQMRPWKRAGQHLLLNCTEQSVGVPLSWPATTAEHPPFVICSCRLRWGGPEPSTTCMYSYVYGSRAAQEATVIVRNLYTVAAATILYMILRPLASVAFSLPRRTPQAFQPCWCRLHDGVRMDGLHRVFPARPPHLPDQ